MLSVRCNDNNMFRFGLDNFGSTDIIDSNNEYELKMEVPGVTKDNIKISLEDDILSIHIESKNETKDEFLHQEIRKDIDVKRNYQLKDIDSDTLSAKLEDGILTIKAKRIEPKNLKKSILIE